MGGPRDDDRLNPGDISPFREHHAVDDAGDFSAGKSLYDGGAVSGISGYRHGPGDAPGNFIRLLHIDRKDQCRTGCQLPVSLRDGIGGPIHRLSELARGIVPAGGMYPAQVVTDIDPPAEDVGKVVVLDSPAEIALEDDVRIDVIQPHCGRASP